jgi:GT2 family glycosyltransferase
LIIFPYGDFLKNQKKEANKHHKKSLQANQNLPLMPRKLNFSIVPNGTLKATNIENATIYESFDKDPFFEVVFTKPVKAGWYFFTYRFELLSGKIILPKIYFDYGKGYTEQCHWKLFYKGNEIFGLVNIEMTSSRFRFDISEENVKFKHQEVLVKKLLKGIAALSLFTIFSKLGKNPASFITELTGKKGAKNKRKFLRSFFEGNHLIQEYQILSVKPTDHTEPLLSDILKYNLITSEKLEGLQKLNEQLKQTNNRYLQRIPSINIIIPVYNGYEFVEKLLPQLIDNSDIPFELNIIDDCSPDKRVFDLLTCLSKKNKNIKVSRNEKNLGFTKTVNRLLRQCDGDIIVLLNSDIEVPKGWLSRLIFPILHDPLVATVTPMSNAATICSFPNVGDNELLEKSNIEIMNCSLHEMGRFYEDIPTGVGFCMAISQKALRKIGYLNEEAFSRGFGEEVDFCFRAKKNGFRNVLNTGLFIYHKHGGSFTSIEKLKLMNENQKKIEKMYPDFQTAVDAFYEQNIFSIIKVVFLLKLIQKENHHISIFLDHDLGGGTNLFSRNYQKQNGEKVYLYAQYLNPNNNSENLILFSISYKNYKLKFALSDLQVLFDVLDLYGVTIEEIIINNLVSYFNPLNLSKKISQYKQTHKTFIRIFCHDFFFLCPNFLLFREDSGFCHLPADLNTCESCLSKLESSIDRKLIPQDFSDLSTWRKEWGQLLCNTADEIVSFSESTQLLFLKIWPDLASKMVVKPHQIEGFKKFSSKVYRIGILGNIYAVMKGAKFVQDLASYISEHQIRDFRLLSLGAIHPHYDHAAIEKTGPYTIADLHYKLSYHKIDVILIPSIGSETFSYTTREAIESGIPTACFPLGGQYDQVKNYKNGIVVKEMSPGVLLTDIRNFLNKKNGSI